MRSRILNIIQHEIILFKTHPFNHKLYKGTLPANIFKNYLDNDVKYLKVYQKALFNVHTAYDRLNLSESSELFYNFSNYIKNSETKLINKWNNQSGFFDSKPFESKTVNEYTDYLVRVSRFSSPDIAAAALLPCFLLYAQSGASIRHLEFNPRYAFWLQTYFSKAFQDNADKILQFNEKNYMRADLSLQSNIIDACKTSAQFEVKFIDELYRLSINNNELQQDSSSLVGNTPTQRGRP